MSYKLDQLIYSAGRNWFIKSRRLEWLPVRQIDDIKTTKRITKWKPVGRRIRGRPRKRWIEIIEDDLRSMNVRDWRSLCGERKRYILF